MKEFFGKNSIDALDEILVSESSRNILLVCGKNSFERCGAKDLLLPKLSRYNLEIFDDFQANPIIEDIIRGIKTYNDFDLIIAVGGGSAIDVAKSINILSTNVGDARSYIKGEIQIAKKGKPLVAIPTTSGSGSEATSFAVVYIDGEKHSLAHEFILPDYCIIYPQLTYSMSPSLTAVTGLDALSQSIESYWSVNSTEISKEFAMEALRLSLGHIELAVKTPTPTSRSAMARASHLAGKAINISKTTSCHAISYAFTSYFNIPHGHAVSLTLPDIFEYNARFSNDLLNEKRGGEYLEKVMNELMKELGVKTPGEAKKTLEVLIKKIGLEFKFSNLGIKTIEDINLIVSNYNVERGKNNPVVLASADLQKLLLKRL